MPFIPTKQEVIAELKAIKRTYRKTLRKCALDVLLRVAGGGAWEVVYGEWARCPEGRRGHWGAAALTARSNCEDVAAGLIDQVAYSMREVRGA